MFWSNLPMQFLKTDCLLFISGHLHIMCKLMFIVLGTETAEEA